MTVIGLRSSFFMFSQSFHRVWSTAERVLCYKSIKRPEGGAQNDKERNLGKDISMKKSTKCVKMFNRVPRHIRVTITISRYQFTTKLYGNDTI